MPERERLAASAKYEEARKITEAQIKETGHASSAKLTVLCISYAGLKSYGRLFDCCDRLEKNIKQGDKSSTDLDELAKDSPILGGMAKSKYANNQEMMGDISYLPHVLRAEAYIDQSHLSNNPSRGFETDPGIFVLAGTVEYIDSVIE